MKEELAAERKNKASGQLEARVKELVENEQKLVCELEMTKQEKTKRLKETAEGYEREKNQLKQRVAELETKYKEAENAKSQIYLEHEKERSAWSTEKEHLLTQKSEAQELIERLEKRKESLLRENEKIRTNNRNRPRMPSNRAFLPTFMGEADSLSRNSKESESKFDDCSPRPLKPSNFSSVRSITPALRESRVISKEPFAENN